MILKDQIHSDQLPEHIAIIMDGNGRWAKQRGKVRVFGHEKGARSVKEVTESCAELGVKYLTLYAFSTENWKRPKLEVQTLMKLLISSLRKEIESLKENDISLTAIGNLSALPKKVHEELLHVMEETKSNSRMTLTLALSYGSREEIISAFKEISTKVKNNIISPEKIDESIINEHLYTRNLPDVDLLIRTSGEQRISNFLLWQIAYAELYFTEVLWPDFGKENLYEAIVNYQNRERRFGQTSEQLT
ncbi:MAG: isoprenyl transferase [Bacteroidia bacterium]|nr:isoprenyl transferase [Bacteroidia bacterium]MBT8268726.1 isoprenyl transferase [Bacteroidia bacterium]NNF81562.1 isoprenyl transferase [Flavobacteriaceae bacterium]NNK69724.1 isoprenyl transferase [Flavobacteriaceae bacterium]NNL81267.1 isoprenyl transferase [Flavobacteriaceae bacterium]